MCPFNEFVNASFVVPKMSKIRTVEYVRQMNEISDYFDIIDQKGEGTLLWILCSEIRHICVSVHSEG